MFSVSASSEPSSKACSCASPLRATGSSTASRICFGGRANHDPGTIAFLDAIHEIDKHFDRVLYQRRTAMVSKRAGQSCTGGALMSIDRGMTVGSERQCLYEKRETDCRVEAFGRTNESNSYLTGSCRLAEIQRRLQHEAMTNVDMPSAFSKFKLRFIEKVNFHLCDFFGDPRSSKPSGSLCSSSLVVSGSSCYHALSSISMPTLIVFNSPNTMGG